MAKRRGGGGNFAARSAAAKKGWETRRRGGAKAKPQPTKATATTPTKPSKSRATAAKPAAAKAPPKTTTARGRARTNATAARKQLKAGGGKRAARSLATAQRAADFYKATNSGKKRSPNRSAGAAPAKATASKAAAKPARSRSGAKPAAQTAGRRPNLRAQRAKAMANRTGVVPGSRYESGQAKRTLSLREMRTAVRQKARQSGVKTASDFRLMYGLGSGLTAKGANGAAVGRMPKTRSDWEKVYKNTIGVPQSDRGLRQRAGVIRGIDIHTNFRPSYVFGLKAGASAADVNRAYRELARQNHPDVGGRAKDFQRLKLMRDSLLATRGGGAAASKPRKGKAKATSTPRARGPLALPAAGGTGKPRRRR